MPPEQLNEQEIQFKKRARRRLVGAVALVLLMITILPMLLDDKTAKMAVPEIEISIPSQDNVKDSTEFASKVVAAPAPKQLQPESKVQVSQTEMPTTAIVPSVSDNAIKSPSPDKVDAKSQVKESVVIVQDKAQVEQKTKTPEKTKESLKQTDLAKASSEFVVQIGVFSSEENVKQLQQKLKDKGFQSNTEKIVTPKGEKIRLRAGTFTDREKAEQALATIKSIGLAGMVVSK